MNIIICDDSPKDRETLIELLQNYAQERNECFEITEYDSGFNLCEGECIMTQEERIMRCDSDSGKKLIKSMVLRTADRQGMC